MKPLKGYSSIKRKLIIIFSAATLVLIICQAYIQNYYEAQQLRLQHLEGIINKSGKQRMFSQKLTKLALQYQASADDDLLHEIDKISQQFSQAHDALRAYNKQLKSAELNTLYNQTSTYLKSLTYHLDELSNKGEDITSTMDSILVYEGLFLPIMDQMVNFYQMRGKQIHEANITQYQYFKLYSIIAAIICAGVALIFTLRTMKLYHKTINQINGELRKSIINEKQKSDKIKFVVDSINVGIWENDLKENTEKWSDNFYRILGMEPGEVEGNSMEFQKLVHPDDLKNLMKASETSIQSGKAETIEIRVKTKSGAFKWVEATGNSQRDEHGNISLLIGGIIDIHKRKTIENQLKVFIERAPAAIAMFDTNMHYLAASNRWLTEYKLTGKDIIGISHYEIFPEIGDDWKQIHQECLAGAVNTNDEAPFVRQDGTTQWIKWEVRPWYISTQEIGGIMMFTEDVTKNKEYKEALKQAKVAAEEAALTKSNFLATMSHEIRTPLNAINGIIHLLLTEKPRPDQLDQLKLLRFSSENLLNLINDILDISKIQAGKLDLSEEPFELRYLLENIKLTLGFKAKEKLIDLNLIIEEGLPEVYLGDSTRLTQILYNLVGNAIKFTDSGSVTISISQRAQKDNIHKLHFEVKDTGKGIAKENQAKIFESFEQEDVGISRTHGGTGLGLFITLKLLELMNSKIELESIPGEGSTFSFELDLEQTNDSAMASNMNLSQNQPDFSTKKLKILIVEDNQSNAFIMTHFLDNVGIASVHVENGALAVECIKEDPHFDLVFMDLRMPVMNGFEATIEIRKLPGEYFQKVPIVALTADAFVDIQEQALSIGMNNYLSKPFKPASLYMLIERYTHAKVFSPTGSNKRATQNRSLKVSVEELKQILAKDAYGDQKYAEKLVTLSIKNYTEFIKDFQKGIQSGNVQQLKNAAHKIKAVNLYLNFKDLDLAIDALVKKEISKVDNSEVQHLTEEINHLIDALKQCV